MSNVELSRRVGKITTEEPIASLSLEDRTKFNLEIDNAKKISDLSDWAKKLILEAEANQNTKKY